MIDIHRRDKLIKGLLQTEGPRVSIFLPTHRAYPENKQDPIEYKNCVQEAEKLLSAAHPRRVWEGIIEQLMSLTEDQDFWNHTTEAMAVLAAGDQMAFFVLDAPLEKQTIVGKHFHLAPIYPLLQSIGHAFLTEINRDRFTIYQVSREGIDQVMLPDIAASFPELFDDFDANADLNVGSYSGLVGTHHGHRARPEEIEKDRDKYFRYLDEAFTSLYKDTGIPMILAGTQSNLAEYRQLAKGDFYLESAIQQPLDSLDHKELLSQVKEILKPHLKKGMENLSTRISNKSNESKAISNISDIVAAAHEGRVELLLLPLQPGETVRPQLDEASEQVLLNGGEILSLDPDEMDLVKQYLALLRY